MVKKTVNFNDPGTYHLRFGDEKGSAGTILTFFPYGQVNPDRRGTGLTSENGYSVPENSFEDYDYTLHIIRPRHGSISFYWMGKSRLNPS